MIQQLVNQFFWPSRCVLGVAVVDGVVIGKLQVYSLSNIYHLTVEAGSVSDEERELQQAKDAIILALQSSPEFIQQEG